MAKKTYWDAVKEYGVEKVIEHFFGPLNSYKALWTVQLEGALQSALLLKLRRDADFRKEVEAFIGWKGGEK